MEWSTLPWIEPLLDPIRIEYSKQPPSHKLIEPSQESFDYVYSVAETPDSFDALGLKKECGKALRQKKATLFQSVSSQGTILLVSLHKSPIVPSWNVWWRSIRLLIPEDKRVRILLFGHPKQRVRPYTHAPIQNIHVNGGYTTQCDPMSIVIYRKEELTRVLIHELFHASCSDPYKLDTSHIEADTEAWAELVLCGMAAKGELESWIVHLQDQITWAVHQATTVRQYHDVSTAEDYAWRYLVGRLTVWSKLGLPIPHYPTPVKPVHSLRFSRCEPEDT
jgi:hypothetical protein